MSLKDFQQAFADMIASGDLSRAIKSNPAILDDRYQLTELEKRRILNVLDQSRGIGTSCMLYQINRFTPILDLMPYTCKALHSEIKQHTRPFWNSYPKTNFQFRDEVLFFGKYLLGEIAKGKIAHIPIIEDVVNMEITSNCIRFGVTKNELPGKLHYLPELGTQNRVLYSKYDIDQILATLDKKQDEDNIDSDAITIVDCYYLLNFVNRKFTVKKLSASELDDLLHHRMSEEQLESLISSVKYAVD